MSYVTTFAIDGSVDPLNQALTKLTAGDTELVSVLIEGFESTDNIASVKLYAKLDGTDSDLDTDTIRATATLTTPTRDSNARLATFTLTSAQTTRLLNGRVYRVEVTAVRATVTYVKTVMLGFIAAARTGATAVAPSDEATLRAAGDAAATSLVNSKVGSLTGVPSRISIGGTPTAPVVDVDAAFVAISASRLQTARTINAVAFDGSSDVSVPTYYAPLAGEVNVLDSTRYYGDPRRHGAINGASVDATQAFRDALTSAGAQPIPWPVKFEGSYLITDTLTMNVDREHLIGTGIYSSRIWFRPTSARVLILLSNGASVLYQCSVENFSILGDPAASAYFKVAIDAYDTSSLLIDKVTTQFWTGNSGNAATPSTSFRSNGRETTVVQNVSWRSDRGNWLSRNPNHASLDVDHFHFQNVYVIVQAAGESAYYFEPDIGIFNLVIDGQQALVAGKHAIYWPASLGSPRATALSIHIGPFRFEASTDYSGAAFEWQGPTTHLSLIDNAWGGATGNYPGLKVRNTKLLSLIGCFYSGTGVAIDVDNTVTYMELVNTWLQVGSSVSLGGMTQVAGATIYEAGLPLPPTSSYVTGSKVDNGARVNDVVGDRMRGQLTSGGNIPLKLRVTGTLKAAIVKIAVSGAGPVIEGGTWIVTANGVALAGNTPNCAIGNVGAKLCILWTSIASIVVINNLGVAVDYVIETTYY